ncbi:CYTH domain-containing protein [Leucobacter weissii]|uniref:CYTH domain-containing protein n=1 Tax=Leucobacter weissii TaxID=1983706 RepID=A0A939ML68_9MICO|nr:CYTH domain-containing protein [Leucobacter weissii]MBO1900667.1 CYTH domain-containing protein [Leucobacter weissii]
MSHSDATESFEIERKYEVGSTEELPSAAAFEALGMVLGAQERYELEAGYFDTPELSLGRLRVAVRRRRGGKDEGWHLKEKGDGGARELLWPYSEQPPAGLRAEIAERIGAQGFERLRRIALLHTERTVARVGGDSGAELVELADDRVRATNELSGRRQSWREWEAEVMPGADPAILDRIEPLLAAAGAARVRGTSKIQRTMAVR